MPTINITDKMKSRFNDDAYLLIEQPVFSEKDFIHLKRYLMAFCKALPEELRAKNFANHPSLTPKFSDWIGSPPLIDLVEQIFGPDIAFWSFGVCYKPAHSNYRVPAHADSHFWIEWNILQPVEVLSLFIPFTEMNTQTGCLRVLPKKNEEKMYKHKPVDRETNFFAHEIEDSEVDLNQMVDIEMQPNQVCILKENLIHSSECNKSSDPRLAITLRYFSAKTKYIPHQKDAHSIFLLKGKNIADNSYQDLMQHEKLGGFSWS